MKIGSLVKCIFNYNVSSINNEYYPNGVPDMFKTYTVRGFNTIGLGGIYLEEIINPEHPLCIGESKEPSFHIMNFREIIFPPSLEQEIKESLNKELQEN